MGVARGRRAYLDWMRGLAVVIMIEAHLLDSWTRLADRDTTAYKWAMIVAGFGAPMFLFLAGVAVALSAAAKARASGDRVRAARQVARRGLEIFGLAFLFRLQAWVLGWGPAWTLLKVDVLNIMGPSILAAAALWGTAATSAWRALFFGAASLAVAILTPFVRATPLLDAMPDPIEAYLRPIAGLTNFTFLPWSGFVFMGALLGVVIERARTDEEERRVNAAAGVAGATLAALAYAASFMPSPFHGSSFWTSSPAFFALRVGLVAAATSLAFAWASRPGVRDSRSPSRRLDGALEQLGRTSLFVYWIHVELVYGLISLPLHKALTLPQACTALAAFVALMLACSIWKDRAAVRWRARRERVISPAITS